ncbi:MAG: SdpI family protein [Agathobacter sp.]|nr:SdpI family protein [Agathobacter sp.]
MKKNLKTMIITSIIILAPIVAGLILWDKLPAEMATHFGENGEPNGWSSKEFAVFGMPLFLLAVHWFCAFFTGVDPKKENISNKMMTLVLWICPVVAIFGCGSTYMYALDNSINTTAMGILLVGCMFLVVGNYMPKVKQSYTLGIKLPWTLNSEENWNRTHRFAGGIWMLAGVLVLVGGFAEQFWVVFVAILLAVAIPTVYSYILFKKGI